MSTAIERVTAFLEHWDAADVAFESDSTYHVSGQGHDGVELTRDDLRTLLSDVAAANQSVISLVDQLIDGMETVLTNATDAVFVTEHHLFQTEVHALHQRALDTFRVASQAAGDGML